MSWVEQKPDLYSEYNGIHVGFRLINYSKFVARQFAEWKWEYIKIEYDLENFLVRFTKSERMEGHKTTKAHTITTKIGKVMPHGRYMCEVGKQELIFKKYEQGN